MSYHIAYSTGTKAQRANSAINSLIQNGGRTGQRPTERRTQTTAPYTSTGTTGSTDPTVLCQVVTAGLDGQYTVLVYDDLDSSIPSGTSILYATEIAYGSTLPVGSKILGHRKFLKVTEVV